MHRPHTREEWSPSGPDSPEACDHPSCLVFCRNSCCSAPVLPLVFIYGTDTVSDAARNMLLIFTPLSSHRIQQDGVTAMTALKEKKPEA